MRKFRYLLVPSLIAVANIVNAEIITAAPGGVFCVAAGTGAGRCDIVFPTGTVSSCANSTHVNFDPRNDLLGTEIYSMALAAVSAGKTLQISLLGCNASGKAGIDWIHIK